MPAPARMAPSRSWTRIPSEPLGITAFGGFLATQQAARRMVPNGHGAICSPAPRPASKAFRSQPPSPWENSRFVALRKVRRANLAPRAFMSRISHRWHRAAPAEAHIPGLHRTRVFPQPVKPVPFKELSFSAACNAVSHPRRSEQMGADRSDWSLCGFLSKKTTSHCSYQTTVIAKLP